MPSISDSIKTSQGLQSNGYVASAPVMDTGALQTTLSYDPGRNSMIRCPVPTLWEDSSDTQRQFYLGGAVPQFRIMTPKAPGVGSGVSSSSGTIVSSGGSGGGSSGGGGSTVQPTAQQVSITSGPLGPGQTFASTLQVAKSFALLTCSANSPVRIQLYGTQQAQSSDSYRALDVPPPAGTIQNIICDVALDTVPLVWSFQDRVGANADSPQTSTIYLRLTNISNNTSSITVTLGYVPLET